MAGRDPEVRWRVGQLFGILAAPVGTSSDGFRKLRCRPIERAPRAAARSHKRERSGHLVLYCAVVLSAMR